MDEESLVTPRRGKTPLPVGAEEGSRSATEVNMEPQSVGGPNTLVLSLASQKELEVGRWRFRSDLEGLLFAYSQDYPKLVRSGFDRRGKPVYGCGPQDGQRLFLLYAGYAVSICELLNRSGLWPDPQQILREVQELCCNLRPDYPDLVHNADFRQYIIDAVNQCLGSKPPRTVAAVSKKRGRPTRFTQEQLRTACDMKQAGKRNYEIARILYNTKTPTPEQRRSVPTVLKHHFPSKK